MITVAILINGNPLVAKNCINTGKRNKSGLTKYKTDEGGIILHDPLDGAVSLAHKLLDRIKNEKPLEPERLIANKLNAHLKEISRKK